jgi:hypothetical protein
MLVIKRKVNQQCQPENDIGINTRSGEIHRTYVRAALSNRD